MTVILGLITKLPFVSYIEMKKRLIKTQLVPKNILIM